MSSTFDTSERISREKTERILRLRADRLALRDEPAEECSDSAADWLFFTVGSRKFAVEAVWAVEASAMTEICRIPGTPRFVLGVVDIRGRVVSVVDLAAFMELSEQGGDGSLSPSDDSGGLVLLRGGGMEFAVRADTVLGVSPLIPGEFTKGITVFEGRLGEFVAGVGVDGSLYLDGAKVISDSAMIIEDSGGH